MLINYFIEPSAIPVDGGIDRVVRKQILDAINDYGIRAGNNRSWREVLERIPQNERKLWEVALLNIPQNEFDFDFLTSSSADEILDRARSSVVALSDSSFARWADECGHPLNSGDEIFSLTAPTIPSTAEVLTIPFFSDSSICDDRRHWNEIGVTPGDNRDEVWVNRILPILQHSKILHIFDRYFLRQISNSADSRQRQRDSGPFWLAEKLRTDLPKYPIALNLYTLEVEGSLDSYSYEMLNEFREASGSGLSELNCYLPENGTTEVIPHDRYWRGASSKWSAKIEFGSSIEMFRNSKFTQNFQLRGFVLSPTARKALMGVEREVQARCQSPLQIK